MRLLVAVLLSLSLAFPATAQVTGYYRHPDLHASTIIFNAEGDLWTVAATGGVAQRLTTHLDQEAWPVLSPDGEQVAFQASYDGRADTYVMPVRGGAPTRISWDNARPVAWTPEGHVVLRTTAYSQLPQSRLVTVEPTTGAVTDVPLSQAAEAAVAADNTLYFTRQGKLGSNSRWYKGGLAQNLWRFAPGDSEATALTPDYPGTSRQPHLMADGRLYFLSDREGAMNIWSMQPDGTDLQRHTTYEDWDIQELGGDATKLVYRLGADLWTFDPSTGANTQLTITLTTDRDQALTDWETKPMEYLSDVALAHNGAHVAFVARGELFVAPVDGGRVVHASRNSEVRYRNVVFSSDTTHVLALSDRTGELEWWRTPIDGTAPPTQITDGPAMLRQDGHPSPDGRYLAHTDYDGHLWLVDLERGSTTRIAEAYVDGAVAWSPDNRLLVYSHAPAGNVLAALMAYDVTDGTTTSLTSRRFMDANPAFAADGSWLFFISTRTWNSTVGSPWGERAPQPHFEDTAKLYALPLTADATWPFRDDGDVTPTPLPASLSAPLAADDVAAFLREVPIPAGRYTSLSATDDRLFFRTNDDQLMALDLKADAEPIVVAEDVDAYEVAGNGEQILIHTNSDAFHVIPASASAKTALDDDTQVALGRFRFPVDKRAEWTQIYHDAWRLHRDYFWDPDMHGVDWEAMRDKYATLLPRVGDREELSDLQAQLVAELSLLHSSAGGGDTREEGLDVGPATLGGRFERDADTGGFRLVHRYVSDPDLPEYRSPLAHPDAQVEEGSIVLAINGQPTQGVPHLGALLMDQAGTPVRLSVQRPDGARREVLVTALGPAEDYNLRYHEWEYTRRLEAESRSDGTIGYVHLRAMGGNDIGQWTRDFYSQVTRQGLILDVRHNNGGNIDSWILSQLLRQPWMYFKPRAGDAFPNMQWAFGGHLVVLVDERTASDGEAVADGFRRLGLGPVIGTRTWGGEVWLTSSNRQVDGGIARASELGVYGPEGEWLLEGWGVVPDIVVDNLPHATYNGEDAQLQAAIDYLQARIAEDPRTPPEPPPYPTLIPGSGFPTPWHQQR